MGRNATCGVEGVLCTAWISTSANGGGDGVLGDRIPDDCIAGMLLAFQHVFS